MAHGAPAFSSFVFSKIVLWWRIPPHCEGALRAIVTTREAGSDGRERSQRVFGRADERSLADVKSQRPDTPMLVSRS
jgi:hypothetical protein